MTVYNENDYFLDDLEELLPHGSGIDYAYELDITDKYLIIKNGWHFMNDAGFYMTGFPFTIRIPIVNNTIDWENFKLSFQVVTSAYYYINGHGIRDYLNELYYYKFSCIYWEGLRSKAIEQVEGVQDDK